MKNFLKKLFDFYLNSSIHVGLSVVSLSYLSIAISYKNVTPLLLIFIFCCACFSYNFIKFFPVLLNKKKIGVTEYLAAKCKIYNRSEVMLISNNKLSVCPITTHIDINQVSKHINKNLIVKKVSRINSWYKKRFEYNINMRKIFFVVSKLVVYGFLILLAYYGYLVLTLITGETLVTLEWVPQPFVQSVIPIASCLFILSETLRIPEDYKNLVLQNTGDEQTGDI